MPNHLFAVDSNRHPPQGASAATSGQVMRADGADVVTWVSFGGDVSGPPNNLAVIDLTIASQAQGDLLYYNGTNWTRLPIGTASQVLRVNAGATAPEWATGGGGGIGGSTGATDNAVLRADGTGGATLQNSGVTIDDSGNITTTGTTINFPSGSVAVGGNNGTLGSTSLLVGYSAAGNFTDVTAVGHAAVASGSNATTIGRASAAGSGGTTLGRGASSGTSCVSVGVSASTAGRTSSIAIGRSATCTANNQLVIGGDGQGITAAYIGQGVTDAAPDAVVTINATGGSGTNIVPSALRLAAGIGTGNAAGSLIYLSTSSIGASGATAQTLVDRVIIGGSSTLSSLLLGNPDDDNQVATPVNSQILATSGNGAAQGGDFTIAAGDNFSTGAAGDLRLRAGSSLGVGAGGDMILEGGNSGSGVGGTLRLRTGNVASAVDRLTIGPTGDVGLTEQSATGAMPTHYWQRHRFTHNSGTQTVLSFPVPSGASLYVDVRVVWNRATATTGAATSSVFGGAWNNGGTTDEIGGATITGTALRSGQASTDAVNVQLVANNTSDELEVQLTKSNANDYVVDVFVLVHPTA